MFFGKAKSKALNDNQDKNISRIIESASENDENKEVSDEEFIPKKQIIDKNLNKTIQITSRNMRENSAGKNIPDLKNKNKRSKTTPNKQNKISNSFFSDIEKDKDLKIGNNKNKINLDTFIEKKEKDKINININLLQDENSKIKKKGTLFNDNTELINKIPNFKLKNKNKKSEEGSEQLNIEDSFNQISRKKRNHSTAFEDEDLELMEKKIPLKKSKK